MTGISCLDGDGSRWMQVDDDNTHRGMEEERENM